MDFLLFLIFPALLGMYAQQKVHGAFRKYSQIGTRSRVSGRDAAAYLLRQAGITDVEIVPVRGMLSDHYDPTNKRLALSEGVYNSTSIAAVGIAAHEAGHAIQDKVRYPMLGLRSTLVPITSLASRSLPFILIGGFLMVILGAVALNVAIMLGVAAFAVLTLFQLVTLPVEFDASKRAKQELSSMGIIDANEAVGVSKVLDAAALTYVAAFIAALGNLLYWLSIARR